MGASTWEFAHKEGGAFAASEPQAHILKKSLRLSAYSARPKHNSFNSCDSCSKKSSATK